MSTREMWADEMLEKVAELETQVTTLKAERDEARNEVLQLISEP